MPAFRSTAPGKIILFGEHAVVYGRPAIAAPVSQVQAQVTVAAAPRQPAGEILIQAPDVGLRARLADLPTDHPLRRAVEETQRALGVARLPACTLHIASTIPVASGLGSGAAVSVALVRALAAFLGHSLPDEQVSALAFEVEKLHHGTPSGVDNTVITYACPVYFVRGQPIERLRLAAPFTLAIGDTGIASPTALAVGDLRRAWQVDPARYEPLFDAAGEIARAARRALEAGTPEACGPLMDENHRLLQGMGVSCPELDILVSAARAAGALGAKLSGGGRGGNMIALAPAALTPAIIAALLAAGARRAFATLVQ